MLDALRRMPFKPVSSTFNICAHPAQIFKEMQQLVHRFGWPLPWSLARGLHAAACRLTSALGETAWLRSMRHTLVMNTDKARRQLDGQPRRSAQDCLRQLFAPPHGTTTNE